MQREAHLRARPARKIFYDWDEATKADRKLAAAFERTNPGADLVSDDEPTLVRWALPLGALVLGFFISRWWSARKDKTIEASTVPHKDVTKAQVGGDGSDSEWCGFDELGCE